VPFDLLIADGIDLRPLPLRERKVALARIGKDALSVKGGRFTGRWSMLISKASWTTPIRRSSPGGTRSLIGATRSVAGMRRGSASTAHAGRRRRVEIEHIIEFQELAGSGMPAVEGNQILYALEDKISKNLLSNDNGIFLARATCRRQRELSYRVKAPKDADQWLTLLVAQPNPREWQDQMEYDADWSLAAPFEGLDCAVPS
jgi:hypothetical protein